MAPNRNFEREIVVVVGIVPNFRTNAVQYQFEKFVRLLVPWREILRRIIEHYLFTFVGTRSPDIPQAPVASRRPELDGAPVTFSVNCSVSCWHTFQCSESPPAWERSHVCWFISPSPGKQRGAMKRSRLCACKCSERFFGTFAHAGK